MNQTAVVSKFSHVKPGDTQFKEGGLRTFSSIATSALPMPPAGR